MSTEEVPVTVATSSVVQPAAAVVVTDDLTAVLHQAGRAAFGVAAVATDVLVRALVSSTSARAPDPRPAGAPDRLTAGDAADVVLGLGWRVSHWALGAGALTVKVTSPVVALAMDPPLVPQRLRPGSFLRDVAATWVAARPGTARSMAELSASIAPVASDVVGGMVDQQTLWPRAFALLDVNRALDAIIGELDLDHLASSAVARLDLERTVRQVLDGLDLTTLVAAVLRDTDLGAVTDAALEQLDLTAVILEHVDMDALVTGIMGRLDVTALVLDNVDLDAVADAVLEGIDLPQLVRESSAGVTSETVDSVRLQAMVADRAVARLADRLLLRGHRPR